MNLPYQDFKVQLFPAFEEECERKAAGLFWQSVAVMPPLDMNAHV